MEYRGEYCISPFEYDKLKKKIIKNKTNTSWITFPNGIKNKAYLNFNLDKKDYDIYILDPLNKHNRLIVKKNILNLQPQKLVMYNSNTDFINAEIEEHFDNYEPHDF